MTLELVVVTGLSGAGRSTAAHHLEDLGWFVVDNLPPSLLATMVELAVGSEGAVEKIAVVTDTRSRPFVGDLETALAQLAARGTRARVLFLEANDEALVRRFDSVRRPHPLQGDGGLVAGIARERVLLRETRAAADLVLDTSLLNVYELRDRVGAAFDVRAASAPLQLTLMSFGYKYGLPVDADLVVDCRFLPNPHWVQELRPQTGQDSAVRDYVLSREGAGEFVDRYEELVQLLSRGYLREGKRYALLAVGCTGGKHRSVAIAEELGRRLAADGLEVVVQHRDLGRE
ncbi:MAG: RNase adapter RapZ [Mycobacteriales bacterium]